jgi:hypothetical protein
MLGNIYLMPVHPWHLLLVYMSAGQGTRSCSAGGLDQYVSRKRKLGSIPQRECGMNSAMEIISASIINRIPANLSIQWYYLLLVPTIWILYRLISQICSSVFLSKVKGHVCNATEDASGLCITMREITCMSQNKSGYRDIISPVLSS